MAGKSEQVNVDLTATDKDASKKVDALADKVEGLEEHPAEVEVTADTSSAVRELKAAGEKVEALERADAEVVIKARIDALKSEVDKAEDELRHLQSTADETGDHVSGVGGGNKVNAIRDLTGPLGEVSSQLGDMGESFTAAGELIEEKMGLAGGSISGLLGPIGLAAGGVFAFWQMYKAKAEEAKKATMEAAASITELGATAAAEKKISDLLKGNPDLVTDVQKLGLGYSDLVKLIQGQTVPAYDKLAHAHDVLTAFAAASPYGTHGASNYQQAIRDTAKELGITEDQLKDLLDPLDSVTGSVNKQQDQFAKARDMAGALADVMGRRLTPEMADVGVSADTSTRSLQDVQKELHGIDGTHARADVNVTDNGTAGATKRGIDDATKPREVVVTLVDPSGNRYAPGYAVGGLPGSPRSAPPTTNVTIHAPRGMRAADLIAAGDRYARRNGGRATRARR